jgi:hypothetical protein
LRIKYIPDSEGDDVALAVAGETVWLAWSTASLERERAVLATWDGAAWSEPLPIAPAADHSFRPAVVAAGGGVIAVACALRGGSISLAGVSRVGGATRRWTVDVDGAVYGVALAAASPDAPAWIAWEQRRGAGAQLCVGRVVDAGGGGHVECVAWEPWFGGYRRSPALAADPGGAWLAWIEGPIGGAGRVAVARIDERGVITAGRRIDDHPAPQSSPAVAATASGAVVAWHSRARDTDALGVTRWLRAAAIDRAQRATPLHPIPIDPDSQPDAGTDQGWEFPALAVSSTGAVWLAGRSSHGFHAATLRPDGVWSERQSLSNDDWGGRGRRLALAEVGGAMMCARREPDGIAVTALADTEQVGLEHASRAPTGETEGRARRAQPAGARRPEGFAQQSSGRDTRGASSRADILFGDLHEHTAHSDGCGSPDDLYLAARDERGLDFAAVTDHDRFCRRAIGPATWRFMRDVADAFDDPGRFTTFAAYEFTGARHPGPGHKCVYFGSRVPDRVPDKDVDTLFALLREYGGIAVPHHVGWTGTDVAHHDPEIQPVWEVCSVHGCYECHGCESAYPPRDDVVLPGHFVRDALDQGLRFGFIGSTDSHGLLWHHGISPKRDPFRAGLAAVSGAERDRDSILAALRARRCYATTGARIVLRADFDGAAIGAELPAGSKGQISVDVTGAAPLAEVVLVRPSGETRAGDVSGARCAARFDVAPAGERGAEFAYVRVVQADGETAWTSPWWIG